MHSTLIENKQYYQLSDLFHNNCNQEEVMPYAHALAAMSKGNLLLC